MGSNKMAPKLFSFAKARVLLAEYTIKVTVRSTFFAFKFEKKVGLIVRIERPFNGYRETLLSILNRIRENN